MSIRTANLSLTLPNHALYRTNIAPGSSYLVETDSQFTNYRNWMSSDFMLNQLQSTPDGTIKKLGDGFYEQQLVQQQIQQAVGQRYLAGYASNEAQYMALMSAGVQQAQTFHYTVGVALTDAQIAQLTSDIVWMVKQTVTLSDGTAQEVLVPQVYLRAANVQVTGQGALIAGNDVAFQTAQDIVNSGGTIAARKNVFRLTATLDDGGARATGKYQAGLALAYDNWWTLNDLFYVNLNRSLGQDGDEGSSGYAVHYSLPFGYWLFAATLSGSKYHQTVAGAFENFVYSGGSEATELKLSRLVYRDSVRKTTLHLKSLLCTASNAIDDTEIGPQRRRTTAWEVGANHREFIGNSTLDASLAYRRSLDRQGAEPASELDLPQIATRYGMFLADASINVPFALGPIALRYSTTARAQWNRGNLPPQDQFSIGGRYTVRGLDGDLTLQAERGWFVRNELSTALGQSGQEFYVGVDTGEVSGPSAQFLTGRRLTGAAIGARGALYKMSYDAFLATPLARPDNFATARVTGGFSVSWAF